MHGAYEGHLGSIWKHMGQAGPQASGHAIENGLLPNGESKSQAEGDKASTSADRAMLRPFWVASTM